MARKRINPFIPAPKNPSWLWSSSMSPVLYTYSAVTVLYR